MEGLLQRSGARCEHQHCGPARAQGQGHPSPGHVPASRMEQGKSGGHKCSSVPSCSLVLRGKRDATKEIKASMVCGSATVSRLPRIAHGARVQLAREAALVPSPFMQNLVRRTHLLPFRDIWATGTRTKLWGQAEDLQLNSRVSYLQQDLQISQALYRRRTKNAHSCLAL